MTTLMAFTFTYENRWPPLANWISRHVFAEKCVNASIFLDNTFITNNLSVYAATMWKPDGWNATERISSLATCVSSKVFCWYDQTRMVLSFEQVTNSSFLIQVSRPVIAFEWNEHITYS